VDKLVNSEAIYCGAKCGISLARAHNRRSTDIEFVIARP